MSTITISVDTETEQEFRHEAQERYKGKKGYLGDAITEAMDRWLKDVKQKKVQEEALCSWKHGHKFGKILYKKREELYER